VALFAAALPMASLMALANNLIELRTDAWKMLTQHRRPVAQASDDIGAWHQARDVAGSRPSPYSRLTPSYSPLESLKTLVRSLGARRDCPLLNLATSRHTSPHPHLHLHLHLHLHPHPHLHLHPHLHRHMHPHLHLHLALSRQVLGAISLLALVTNPAVAIFTSHSLPWHSAPTDADRLWAFILIEHALLLLKFFVRPPARIRRRPASTTAAPHDGSPPRLLCRLRAGAHGAA
jgi:hypothetical protein